MRWRRAARSRGSRSRASLATRSPAASTRSARTSRRGRRATASASAGTAATASSATRAGRELFINCEKAQITGISFDGGYAEYAVVPFEAAARIPDDLDAADAGPLLCAGVTTYNSLRNSGARPGDTVAVQGIGGLGHLAIQYAARMGFRTIALSRGADKEELARELGAHEYVDTQKVDAAEGLKKLGGADLVLATAPHSDAIASTLNGLKARGKLLIVAAAFEPLQISALSLLSGKTIAGWPSGSAIDSEETMAFSALTGVRPTDREVHARAGRGGLREGHGEQRPLPRRARALKKGERASAAGRCRAYRPDLRRGLRTARTRPLSPPPA